MSMSEILAGRRIQPGSQKFGKPAHDQFLEVLANHYPQAVVVSEPRVLKKLGFWALIPDFAVTVDDKTVLIEIKRQGAQGNAQERLYKFFTPRLMRQVNSALDTNTYPVYAVLCDELATNARYVREFNQFLEPENYLLWVDYEPQRMVDFLDKVFKSTGTFNPNRLKGHPHS